MDDPLVMSKPRGQLLLRCLNPWTLRNDLDATLCGRARPSDTVTTHSRHFLRWDQGCHDLPRLIVEVETELMLAGTRDRRPKNPNSSAKCPRITPWSATAQPERNERWTTDGQNWTCFERNRGHRIFLKQHAKIHLLDRATSRRHRTNRENVFLKSRHWHSTVLSDDLDELFQNRGSVTQCSVQRCAPRRVSFFQNRGNGKATF